MANLNWAVFGSSDVADATAGVAGLESDVVAGAAVGREQAVSVARHSAEQSRRGNFMRSAADEK